MESSVAVVYIFALFYLCESKDLYNALLRGILQGGKEIELDSNGTVAPNSSTRQGW